jgi:hypothetical protein
MIVFSCHLDEISTVSVDRPKSTRSDVVLLLKQHVNNTPLRSAGLLSSAARTMRELRAKLRRLDGSENPESPDSIMCVCCSIDGTSF